MQSEKTASPPVIPEPLLIQLSFEKSVRRPSNSPVPPTCLAVVSGESSPDLLASVEVGTLRLPEIFFKLGTPIERSRESHPSSNSRAMGT
jgi:hypothetical protein